jgi:hypothetical protein
VLADASEPLPYNSLVTVRRSTPIDYSAIFLGDSSDKWTIAADG